MNIAEITPEEAKKRLDSDKGYVYLDVRTVPEYVAGHAPGSINVPVVEKNIMTSGWDPNERFLSVVEANIPRDTRVIVGCRTGGRSAYATDLMIQAGYKEVANLVGGYAGISDESGQVVQEGWSTLGYPVERGEGGNRGYRELSAKSPK